jgi:hypothetical protein
MRDGHLAVPTYVNGAGPYPFILDTGADGGGVYEWFAERFHLRAGKSSDLSGQTGTIVTPTYRIKSLSIDGHAIKSPMTYGLPNRHDAGEEAGVAGNDLMDGTVTIFDFPCNRVEIHPKPVALGSLVPRDATRVDGGNIKDGTVLTIPVEVNGVTGVALLDTGSRDTRINPQFAAASHIDPSSPSFRDGDLLYGANSQAKTSRIGPVGEVRFGGMTVPHPQIRVIDLPAFQTAGVGNHVMILGTDLMRTRRLVYDYQAKHIWFGSSKCTSASSRNSVE